MNFALTQCTQLSLQSMILKHLPAGHRQYISLRDQRGNVLAERILDRSSNSFEADLTQSNTAAAAPHVFERFLILGIQHIFTGYDHLLFLIGLLVTGLSARASAKVITSFTLAHSLTLALSATGRIQLSPRFVDPLIAVSIIYVGVENIMRREPRGRELLTFGFGLIHGLGFASALREGRHWLAHRGRGAPAGLLQPRRGDGAGFRRGACTAVDMETAATTPVCDLLFPRMLHVNGSNRNLLVCAARLVVNSGQTAGSKNGWLCIVIRN